MLKKTGISLFFSAVLMFIIVTPILVSVIESSFDVTVVIDINEEEKNEKESKVLELNLLHLQTCSASAIYQNLKIKHGFYFNLYHTLHLEHSSPPPEQFV